MDVRCVSYLNGLGFFVKQNRSKSKIAYVEWNEETLFSNEFLSKMNKVLKKLNDYGWAKMTDISPFKISIKEVEGFGANAELLEDAEVPDPVKVVKKRRGRPKKEGFTAFGTEF